MESSLESKFVTVDGTNIHYLEGGSGEPVLFLHGFPTSSFLWRNVAKEITGGNRVILIDMPGYGQSDKPLDVSYSIQYYAKILTGFLDALDIESTSLVVHDLGGPIGIYWACLHSKQVQKLAFLNTLVYPKFSRAIIVLMLGCRAPIIRSILTSPWGLKSLMRRGVHDKTRLADDAIPGVQAPFETRDARRALLKAAAGFHPKDFEIVSERLPKFEVPVRIIYGERDRILHDVAKTMARIKEDLPQAEITALPDCGHFLQEERPEEIGKMLAEFLSRPQA